MATPGFAAKAAGRWVQKNKIPSVITLLEFSHNQGHRQSNVDSGQYRNLTTAYPSATDLPQQLLPTHATVESGMGAVAWGLWPSPRFPSLLIEPDVRSYRIRLSDWLHCEAHSGAGRGRRQRAPELSQALERCVHDKVCNPLPTDERCH
jgi:hypothetical protein